MNTQHETRPIKPANRPRSVRSWLARHARGHSLPIVATLAVLLLGLPDELVEVLRELPCHSGFSECCETATGACNSADATTTGQRGVLNPLADQSRDIVVDWLSRIWTVLF